MSDNDMLRRGDVLKAVDMWESDWPCTYSAILALPAVSAKHDFAQLEALTADNARLQAALECLLIEYDYAELAQAEPPSLTAAVFSARDALNTGEADT